MIYLFGQNGQEVSIVYSDLGLSEEQKATAIKVFELPTKPEERENFRLAIVNRNGIPTWEYIDITDVVSKQIQDAIDAYTQELIEGGLL